jgi:hypothetical protein
MSITIKAITKTKLDWNTFFQELRNNDLREDIRGINKAPTYQFYSHPYSTRGVEITQEDYGYEIRMTVCCNATDYLLANTIAFKLKQDTQAQFFNEDESEIYIGRLFDDITIAKKTYEDVEILKALIPSNKEITLFGTVRGFNIGRVFGKKIIEITGDNHAIAYKFSNLFLNSQYPSDEFAAFTNLMQVTRKDGEVVLVQNFFNTQSMIIEKVHTVSFVLNDKTIYLNPKHLVQFLPDSWQLLDEYTIAAKQLSNEEWFALFHSMIPFDGGVETIDRKK